MATTTKFQIAVRYKHLVVFDNSNILCAHIQRGKRVHKQQINSPNFHSVQIEQIKQRHPTNISCQTARSSWVIFILPEAQGPISFQQGTVVSILLDNPYSLESGVQQLKKLLHWDAFGWNQNPKQSHYKPKINEFCEGFNLKRKQAKKYNIN